MEIANICKRFSLKGDIVKVKMLTSGIINNTYQVTVSADGVISEYIIQKINKNVFKRPDLVMQNILKISQHLIKKLSTDKKNYERTVLEYVLTDENYACHIDSDGEYWRCYRYINDSVTYNNPDGLEIIEQAGLAYGQFQSLLTDFDAESLHASIPDFHNTKKRFVDLFSSAYLDVASRVFEAREELEYLKTKQKIASSLCDMVENNLLPIRVTHNDTKCNNVLFDKLTNKALAVIDLDTVMPGLVAYDYGDAIRCIAATCEEDEVDLGKVQINMDKLKAFTKGFVSKVRQNLTSKELDSLPLGIVVITLELASRFLKDYLDGDVYFKTNHQKHNLERARCQIELAKEFEKHFDEIVEYIKSFK